MQPATDVVALQIFKHAVMWYWVLQEAGMGEWLGAMQARAPN